MEVLRVRSLTKRFGHTTAVGDVSLTVGRGQIYGLLGPNGSGKTTTLACALGLLRPDAGSTELLGQPWRRVHRTLGRVGVVFDSATLLPALTARQNLEYARRLLGHAGGRAPDAALELVDLAPLADRRAGRMSLGQQRRLAIARALIGAPELLIMDEPLSGLDIPGVRSMLHLFRELSEQGLTLVLSSHRLHEMETVVSHVAILLGGRLARECSLDELLAARRGAYLLSAEPRARTLETLGRCAGVRVVDGAEDEGRDGLRVQLADDDGAVPRMGAVVRALVEAGCEVEAVVPERATLQAAFEALLDQYADEAAAARGAP